MARTMANAPRSKAAAAESPAAATVAIDLTPSPESSQAVALRTQADAIVIADKASHTAALEFLRGAKQLKRNIEAHWKRIKSTVDDLKRNLLSLERQDVAPVEGVIEVLNERINNYEREAERVRKETEDRLRREAEERGREDRQRQLDDLERAALTREAESEDLSERERRFVDLVASGSATVAAAEAVGYKDPEKAAARLMDRGKIKDAIQAKRDAAAIRTQASNVRSAPIATNVPAVKSEVGKVAGMRKVVTHRGVTETPEAEKALFDAVVECIRNGTTFAKDGVTQIAIPFDVLKVDASKVNAYAKQLEAAIATWPGVTYTRDEQNAG